MLSLIQKLLKKWSEMSEDNCFTEMFLKKFPLIEEKTIESLVDNGYHNKESLLYLDLKEDLPSIPLNRINLAQRGILRKILTEFQESEKALKKSFEKSLSEELKGITDNKSLELIRNQSSPQNLVSTPVQSKATPPPLTPLDASFIRHQFFAHSSPTHESTPNPSPIRETISPIPQELDQINEPTAPSDLSRTRTPSPSDWLPLSQPTICSSYPSTSQELVTGSAIESETIGTIPQDLDQIIASTGPSGPVSQTTTTYSDVPLSRSTTCSSLPSTSQGLVTFSSTRSEPIPQESDDIIPVPSTSRWEPMLTTCATHSSLPSIPSTSLIRSHRKMRRFVRFRPLRNVRKEKRRVGEDEEEEDLMITKCDASTNARYVLKIKIKPENPSFLISSLHFNTNGIEEQINDHKEVVENGSPEGVSVKTTTIERSTDVSEDNQDSYASESASNTTEIIDYLKEMSEEINFNGKPEEEVQRSDPLVVNPSENVGEEGVEAFADLMRSESGSNTTEINDYFNGISDGNQIDFNEGHEEEVQTSVPLEVTPSENVGEEGEEEVHRSVQLVVTIPANGGQEEQFNNLLDSIESVLEPKKGTTSQRRRRKRYCFSATKRIVKNVSQTEPPLRRSSRSRVAPSHCPIEGCFERKRVSKERLSLSKGCGTRFMQLLKLQVQRRLYNERPHICDCCGKPFRQLTTLLYHKRSIHKKENPFVCRVIGCKKSFKRYSAFKGHMRVCHKGI